MYQDVDAVNELIRSGKWVDKPDSRGVTPIMMAAERGDLRVAEALLRGGANPRRAVAVAQKRHDAEMVRLLTRYAGR
jgi:ankyrin repeat protein